MRQAPAAMHLDQQARAAMRQARVAVSLVQRAQQAVALATVAEDLPHQDQGVEAGGGGREGQRAVPREVPRARLEVLRKDQWEDRQEDLQAQVLIPRARAAVPQDHQTRMPMLRARVAMHLDQ